MRIYSMNFSFTQKNFVRFQIIVTTPHFGITRQVNQEQKTYSSHNPSLTHLYSYLPISSPTYHIFLVLIAVTMEVSDLVDRTKNFSYQEIRLELPLNQDISTSTNHFFLAKLISSKSIALSAIKDITFKAWKPTFPYGTQATRNKYLLVLISTRGGSF